MSTDKSESPDRATPDRPVSERERIAAALDRAGCTQFAMFVRQAGKRRRR